MSLPLTSELTTTIDTLYRSESGRVLATLVRLLGDLDLAEEAMHEAFATALESWKNGLPEKPRPWLISTARFKAIDTIRRRARFDGAQPALLIHLDTESDPAQSEPEEIRDAEIADDRLRLIFTCCHPTLSLEGQVALTLRIICGLTTEEVARAFLLPPATLAQRIVRAKAKIREAKLPYEVPSADELPGRLDAVLHVVYLIFNEGYSAATGSGVTREELTGEAIRLGRLLHELMLLPEVSGLLALMLLHESRRAARTSPTGELVLLERQNRAQWNSQQIEEGTALVRLALQSDGIGVYTLQAAIAATHADAPSTAETDWRQIVTLYDQLLHIHPSPIVRLNRAVAVAECNGAEAGLAEIEAILSLGLLTNYHLAHSARAELYRRLGRAREAKTAYEMALGLTQQEPERRFLLERIQQLEGPG